ncbi:DctP family TRAP transporter solute-binding subunit [Oceanomicrobium pacificus]|uniref:DctP family TRAP transporter solute-binding subunit n=1 Tax=Oceanomicrobium pacificus TaxID=2692916 RepID=A0A6B0U6H9_9RHOB|nr:DctP family TRAP transporter solute-binding subunit [Oceanomicrobium pacificus]MXU66471.1 DctP family TRAP transporter solute-binding subunit [Oceanomicrobium pacificus]
MNNHLAKVSGLRSGLAALAVAAGMILSPSLAAAKCDAGEKILKFSLVTAIDGHPKGEAAKAFAERVNREFQGSYCLEIYGNSELYDDDVVFDALLSGDVHFAAPSLSKFGKYTKKLQLFDLPFLFDSPLHVMEFLSTPDALALKNSINTSGFQGLEFWANGMLQMSGARPLRVPADAAGLTFRIQPSAVTDATFRALGAETKTLAFSKVYDALASGEVNAQYNTWSNIQTKGFYLEQAAVTETNFAYLGYMVVTSSAFLDGLDQATRDKFLGLLKLTTHERNRFAFEINQIRRQDIIDDDGIIIRLNEEELQLWRDAFAPVWDQFRDEIGRDLVAAAVKANAEAKPF